MKRIILTIIASLIIATAMCQVTLEQTYSVPPGKQFYYSDLGNNNYKYFLIDYYNNNFSLYNLDHTPYMLNIIPGVPLDSGAFTIAYISTTLFDCDSTNIEYAMTTSGGTVVKPFYVFRTDGTLLFQKDSVVTVWCYGCYGGVPVTPIFNTPAGAKLLLANLTTNDFFVYGLCGVLPLSIKEIENGNQFVQVFPNPTSGTITFQINAPSSTEEYELSIYNSSLQIIRKENVRGERMVTIESDKLSSDTYFFSLQTPNKIMQTGKFVIAK